MCLFQLPCSLEMEKKFYVPLTPLLQFGTFLNTVKVRQEKVFISGVLHFSGEEKFTKYGMCGKFSSLCVSVCRGM